MNPNPEEKSSNEPERLRAELRIQQRKLDALTEKLKAQEELTNDAWEVLAILWRERPIAANPKDQRPSDETVTEKENENFFKGLRLLLNIGRHEGRMKEALVRLQK